MHEGLAAGSLKQLMETPTQAALDGRDGAQIVTDALVRLLPKPLDQAILKDYQTSYRGDRFAVSAEYVRSYRVWLPELRIALTRLHGSIVVTRRASTSRLTAPQGSVR